ncbi:unnamed protein product [Gongylonema pulchrum]|uniref:PilZ domain-containing protein n=1 Tax=Gongylonema pulchrum TaxID=637853 RepID=A0A183DZK2_9BILA|nr:unnamed protein product [Gongylonema pulchrum]
MQLSTDSRHTGQRAMPTASDGNMEISMASGRKENGAFLCFEVLQKASHGISLMRCTALQQPGDCIFVDIALEQPLAWIGCCFIVKCKKYAETISPCKGRYQDHQQVTQQRSQQISLAQRK